MTVPVLATSCTEPFEKDVQPVVSDAIRVDIRVERGGEAHVSALVQVIRGVEKTRPHECPATRHGVPRACHCDGGALREEEDGQGRRQWRVMGSGRR